MEVKKYRHIGWALKCYDDDGDWYFDEAWFGETRKDIECQLRLRGGVIGGWKLIRLYEEIKP